MKTLKSGSYKRNFVKKDELHVNEKRDLKKSNSNVNNGLVIRPVLARNKAKWGNIIG